MKIIFLPNGETACADDQGQQVPELQQSWLRVFFNWLDDHDVDPTDVEFTLPGGQRVRAVDQPSGFNWQVVVDKNGGGGGRQAAADATNDSRR